MTKAPVTEPPVRPVVDNVGVAYRALRAAKIRELYGRWVSGLEPILLERVDVSPEILAQFALTHDSDVEPAIINQIHWRELTTASPEPRRLS